MCGVTGSRVGEPGYRPDVTAALEFPDAPPPGTPLPVHYAGCYGCGDVVGGLRMRFVTGEPPHLSGTFEVTDEHQGAPGIAHGGLLAAAFDEMLGSLAVYHREPAVTGGLETHFRKPVPVGVAVHLQARIDARDGRKIYTSGEARLGAPDGPLACEANAVFIVVPPRHFTEHGRAGELSAWTHLPADVRELMAG